MADVVHIDLDVARIKASLMTDMEVAQAVAKVAQLVGDARANLDDALALVDIFGAELTKRGMV